MAEVPNVHWQALLRDNRPNKPLILAVEGYALAGGTEILQGTDIRVGAENAIFGVTEVARGLYPMSGSTIRLRRQIPYCLAAEILLCGDHISARQALDFGLINKVVPAGTTLDAAKANTQRKSAPTGPWPSGPWCARCASTRSACRRRTPCWPPTQLAGPVFASNDAREGMRAFKEKRQAEFYRNLMPAPSAPAYNGASVAQEIEVDAMSDPSAVHSNRDRDQAGRSLRAFLPRAGQPGRLLDHIFTQLLSARPATATPSPGLTHVASGESIEELRSQMSERFMAGEHEHGLSLRRQVMRAYTVSGSTGRPRHCTTRSTSQREDKAGRHVQFMRNFTFFDAPHVAFHVPARNLSVCARRPTSACTPRP